MTLIREELDEFRTKGEEFGAEIAKVYQEREELLQLVRDLREALEHISEQNWKRNECCSNALDGGYAGDHYAIDIAAPALAHYRDVMEGERE
jgi:hypothetical protein